MKRASLTTICLVCVLAASTCSAAQDQRCAIDAVDRTIRDVVETWKDGYNSGDPAKVAALYAPDAIYLTQHFVTGIVQGRPAIEAYVKKGTDAHYRIEAIKLLSSDCSGQLAYAVTRYEATNAGQKTFGVNLVVLRNISGKWLIVAHESAVPDPATAIQSLESSTAK